MDITKKNRSADVAEEFTEEAWDEWFIENRAKTSRIKIEEEDPPSSTQESAKNLEGLNISYKVEPKDVPKLPKGNLKGRIFDEWHTTFLAKMSQARISDIMMDTFVRFLPTSPKYKLFIDKLDYLKNHILTATINTHASSFLEPDYMDGLKMYQKLIQVFYGKQLAKDRAVQMSAIWE